ncbi:MAG: sterol desaturase family protein [Spirochaetota bacterium]
MNYNIMEYAFPFILVLVLAEMLFAFLGKKQYYHVNTFIGDISNGVLFGLAGIVILAGALSVYAFIETNLSLASLGFSFFVWESPLAFEDGFSIKPAALFSWFVALVLVDFIYYWFHRLAHEINILWACHVTHHSSEELNLSVAFRGNAFQRIFEYIFFLPLAFLGIPWLVFLLCHRIMKIYQCVVHTRFFGKLGFWELFMVTPSNHRVHHGTQPQYIDRNHGGIFIIWDRLFGTYEPEGEEPLYGITRPVETFNPIFNNVHVYGEIFKDVRQSRTFGDKMRIIFGYPGWKPEYMRTEEYGILKNPVYEKIYNPKLPKRKSFYALCQAINIILLGMITWKIAKEPNTSLLFILPMSFFVIFEIVSINGVLDSRSWSYLTEYSRHIFLFCTAAAIYFSNSLPNTTILPYALIPMMTVSLLSTLWFFVMNRQLALREKIPVAA